MYKRQIEIKTTKKPEAQILGSAIGMKVMEKAMCIRDRLKINKDTCVGCKMCMKIGCPAISMRDGKSEIDFTQCGGCNVCSQLCKFDAIEEGK